ncbi:unnamed protein product [Hymenolepis diminuta]|uniref:glutathione-specific gamma-glutamylcyclotransferase n=1 Tax=Hymenolepis diminuta TaxID=6216 RepID=A0A564Z0U8_HYMDI|nr:unnamed protein product [Hymenolepis diminuta]
MASSENRRRRLTNVHVRCPEMLCPETGKLYIFGYGSLIWKPNINYSRSWVGYIKGYKRRFYQGTTTHRGTPEQPGRVLTLLPSIDKEARVWGKVFEVDGVEEINAAIEHLAEREMILGGYRFDAVPFYPFKNCEKNNCEQPQEVIRSFVYIAEPGNDQYIGKAPLEVQARQIALAHGFCGPNSEYLRKLIEFIIKEVPKDELHHDKYSFDLWYLVNEYLQQIASSTEQEVNNSSAILTPLVVDSIATN